LREDPEEEAVDAEVVKDGEKVETMAILLRTTSILHGMDLTVLLIPLPSMVCSTYFQNISAYFWLQIIKLV
jgi:hypothetical protein